MYPGSVWEVLCVCKQTLRWVSGMGQWMTVAGRCGKAATIANYPEYFLVIPAAEMICLNQKTDSEKLTRLFLRWKNRTRVGASSRPSGPCSSGEFQKTWKTLFPLLLSGFVRFSHSRRASVQCVQDFSAQQPGWSLLRSVLSNTFS